MIAFIQGTIVDIEKEQKSIVLDTGNLGYNIYTSDFDNLKLNDDIKLYTHVVYSETDQRVFGFQMKIEKKIFLHLIQISGVGPKTALEVLCQFPNKTFIELMFEEKEVALKKISSVKGIGKKTAETIFIFVKEKIIHLADIKQPDDSKNGDEKVKNDCIDSIVVNALVSLGFHKNQITQTQKEWFVPTDSTENNIKSFFKYNANSIE